MHWSLVSDLQHETWRSTTMFEHSLFGASLSGQVISTLLQELSFIYISVHVLSYVQDYLSEEADWTFEEEISQLPLLSRLSVLELELEMKRHAFAPLVLHLLHEIPPAKELNIELTQGEHSICIIADENIL